MVAKLSDATIEHRLCCSLSARKVYVHESLSHVSQESNSSFYTALGTQTEIMTSLTLRKHIMAKISFKYSPIPIVELIVSVSHVIPVPLRCSPSFVSPSAFSVALEFTLAPKFTLNCESQQLIHN